MTTTLRQFAADVDAAIAANPKTFRLTRAEKDAMLAKADADILKYYGMKSRKEIN